MLSCFDAIKKEKEICSLWFLIIKKKKSKHAVEKIFVI